MDNDVIVTAVGSVCDAEIDRMVRDAFGSSDKASAIRADKAQQLRPNDHRAETMKKTKNFHAGGQRYRTRVVFVGTAVFGPGVQGPCPQKKLLRAMAHRGCVILVDKYRTTQRCCNCGEKMAQQGDSQLFRCENWNNEGCSIGAIDWDANAAINITMIGATQLLGLPWPEALKRPRASSDQPVQETVLEANQRVLSASQGLSAQDLSAEVSVSSEAADAVEF